MTVIYKMNDWNTMPLEDEIKLLIKSKYPVVYFECTEEKYALRQLFSIAESLNLVFYQWSVTEGLSRGDKEGSFYQTHEPVSMLRMVHYLINAEGAPDGLYVFKDMEKYLGDPLILRLFKDVINRIKNSKSTVVILSAEYKLPVELEPDAGHILGGIPSGEELESVFSEMIGELQWQHEEFSVSLSPEEYSRILGALRGLSIQQIRNVLTQCIIEDNLLTIADLSSIEAYKRKIFDQEGLLEFCLTERQEAMAGFPSLKQWLSDRKMSFRDASLPGLPPPRGILLMGVQGCGKSLAVKIIARELALPLYRLDLGRLYSKYIGETEQNLRKAFELVEKMSPLCLWIDEIEKGFAVSSGDMDGGVSKRILGTFLTWMQERKAACFIAATANDVYHLPPEFLRKGRFDEIFFVDLPDKDSREEIFKIQVRKRKLPPEHFDYSCLAEASIGFNGAEIEQAVIAALYRSSGKKTTLDTSEIKEQLLATKPLSVLKREEIETLREWAKERTVPA